MVWSGYRAVGLLSFFLDVNFFLSSLSLNYLAQLSQLWHMSSYWIHCFYNKNYSPQVFITYPEKIITVIMQLIFVNIKVKLNIWLCQTWSCCNYMLSPEIFKILVNSHVLLLLKLFSPKNSINTDIFWAR